MLDRLALSTIAPGGRSARLVIVTYHRVLPEPDVLLRGEPDVESFARQVRSLASLCNVLPLPEAVARLASGRLPARAACVTFDDGYRNNLTLAAPVLKRFGLPATIFVAQQPVQSGVMWNDLVIEAVRRARGELDLSVVGRPNARVDEDRERVNLVRSLLQELKYRPLEKRGAIARRLYADNVESNPPRLMLTEAEVSLLAQEGFDIGGHTVNHPILARLPLDQARREIQDCATWLKGVTGRHVSSFAYPNGRPGTDFDSRHAEIVRQAGFSLAVATTWGVASSRSDTFALPRVSLRGASRIALGQYLGRLYLKSYLRRI